MEALAAASMVVSAACLVLGAGIYLAVVVLGRRLRLCVDSRGMVRLQAWRSEPKDGQSAEGCSLIAEEDDGCSVAQVDHLGSTARTLRERLDHVSSMREHLRRSMDAISQHDAEMQAISSRICDLESQLRSRRAEREHMGSLWIAPTADGLTDESSARSSPEIWRNQQWVVTSTFPPSESARSTDTSLPAFSPEVSFEFEHAGETQAGGSEESKQAKDRAEEERNRTFLVGYLTQRRIDRLSQRSSNCISAVTPRNRCPAEVEGVEAARSTPGRHHTSLQSTRSPGCVSASTTSPRAPRSPRCLSSSPLASLVPIPGNARGASLLVDDSAGKNAPPAAVIQGCTHGLDALALARRRATPLHMIKVRADIGFVDDAAKGAAGRVEEESRTEDCQVEEGGDQAMRRRTAGGEIEGNNFFREAGLSLMGQSNTLPLLEVSEVLCSPGHNSEEDAEEGASGPSGSASEETQQGITDGWQGAGDWYVTDLQVLGPEAEAGVCFPSQRDEQEPCLLKIPDLQEGEDEREIHSVLGSCTTHEARCRPCETWCTNARDGSPTNVSSRESAAEEASEEGDDYDSDYLAFWE